MTATGAQPPLGAVQRVVLALAGLELVLWVLAFANGLFAGVSHEARSINRDAAIFASWVFLLTGAPAFALAFYRRWRWLAVALVLAPALGLAALMIAAV
jgi:hypothetical protein